MFATSISHPVSQLPNISAFLKTRETKHPQYPDSNSQASNKYNDHVNLTAHKPTSKADYFIKPDFTCTSSWFQLKKICFPRINGNSYRAHKYISLISSSSSSSSSSTSSPLPLDTKRQATTMSTISQKETFTSLEQKLTRIPSQTSVKSMQVNANNLVIYELFVRNHSTEGTFLQVKNDLHRLKHLGVDVVFLMAHYPIGLEARKGTQGSPYCIKDYRAINSRYGTTEDFKSLVEATKELGMRLMIDIVFNHTARDSVLAREHPEWFKRDENGYPTSPWSDVADLDFSHRELWDYLVETLVIWAKRGVNGFRCDVATFVPIEFWQEARRRVSEVNPDVLWLAEACDVQFLLTRRQKGGVGLCDAELYRVFDIVYDYDLWFRWCAVVGGRESLKRYLEMLQFQEAYLPQNAVKLRFVENHDQMRIMKRAPSREIAMAWTAFSAFNRGAFLIFDGQESEAQDPPELFEDDPINWGSRHLETFLTTLTSLKKLPAVREGKFSILHGEKCIVAAWSAPKSQSGLLGIFNVLGERKESVTVPLQDGKYLDALNGYGRGPIHQGIGRAVLVENRAVNLGLIGSAVVLEFCGDLGDTFTFSNTLLHFSEGEAVF